MLPLLLRGVRQRGTTHRIDLHVEELASLFVHLNTTWEEHWLRKWILTTCNSLLVLLNSLLLHILLSLGVHLSDERSGLHAHRGAHVRVLEVILCKLAAIKAIVLGLNKPLAPAHSHLALNTPCVLTTAVQASRKDIALRLVATIRAVPVVIHVPEGDV